MKTNTITINLNTLRPTELADLCALLTASAKEDTEFSDSPDAEKVLLAQMVELALINNAGMEDAVELLALAGAHPEILEIDTLAICL